MQVQTKICKWSAQKQIKLIKSHAHSLWKSNSLFWAIFLFFERTQIRIFVIEIQKWISNRVFSCFQIGNQWRFFFFFLLWFFCSWFQSADCENDFKNIFVNWNIFRLESLILFFFFSFFRFGLVYIHSHSRVYELCKQCWNNITRSLYCLA